VLTFFQFLEQLLQVPHRRVVCQLIAQRLPARRDLTPHHFYRAARHPIGLRFVVEDIELDLELADRTEAAGQRAHFLAELLDLRRRGVRAHDRQRLADASRCDTRLVQTAGAAAHEIGPHGAQLVQPFPPEPVTGG